MSIKKPQSPAMEFIVDALKKNRKAAYSDLKAKADEKKLKVFPIMFGRAQAMLGIVKSAKRGTGKAAKASASAKKAKMNGSSKSEQVRSLLATGMTAAEIAKKVGCSVPLVYMMKSAMGRAGKRGPGRPRSVPAVGTNGLEGIVAAVKNNERERAQLRGALERIQGIIGEALA